MKEQIPHRSGELLSSTTPDGTVIVSREDGQLRVVNEVGAFIWDLINGRNSVALITQRVVDRFDVEADDAQADVEAFIRALGERDLVTLKERS
jgi:hypothetical protein